MTIELPDQGYVYVTDSAALDRAVESLKSSTVIGVDTESDSFFSYKESCCLIQVTGQGGPDYIVDPLLLHDLSPLAPLMADPGVVKVFQGADFDIVSMKRDFGFQFENIFDTMLAAQAIGQERFGLFDLVQHYFGVTLNKKYQRHDWSSRPLREEHLEYARLDSHFLPTLKDLLGDEAQSKGRMKMLEEEFGLLEGREWTGRAFDPNDCIRMKGATSLQPDQLRVLRAVYTLRDSIAKQKNRPPFKVWGNDVCLKLAREMPKDRDALRKALGDGHFVGRRYATEATTAVQTGMNDTSPPPAPTKAKRKGSGSIPPFSRDDEPLLSHLKKWRNKRMEDEGVGAGMVVNNNILKGVAALRPSSAADIPKIPDIRKWQVEAYADLLVEAVAEWKNKKPAEGEGSGRRRRRRRKKTRAGAEEAKPDANTQPAEDNATPAPPGTSEDGAGGG